MMKTRRGRRTITLIALTALPVLLAWQLAVRRSWLPVTRKVYNSEIRELRFSSDGRRVMTTGLKAFSAEANTFETDEFAEDSLLPTHRLARVTEAGVALALSPDLQHYARLTFVETRVVTLQNQIVINTLELRDKGKRLLWKHTGPIDNGSGSGFVPRFSPHGRFLVASEDGTLLLKSVLQPGKVLRLKSQSEFMTDGAFAANERVLVTRNGENQLLVWDTLTGRQRLLLATTPSTHNLDDQRGLALSDNGQWLASADEGGAINVWSSVTGKYSQILHDTDGPVEALAFAPDNRTLASGDTAGTLALWDAQSGANLRVMELPGIKGKAAAITTLAWSPDGSVLVSGDKSGRIARWRIK